MPDWFHFRIEWAYASLAALGGGARYLNIYMNGGKFRWSIFLANLLVSGFSGLMFALMGQSMNFPPALLYVSAGVGGFFGTNTLEFLAGLIQKRMEI